LPGVGGRRRGAAYRAILFPSIPRRSKAALKTKGVLAIDVKLFWWGGGLCFRGEGNASCNCLWEKGAPAFPQNPGPPKQPPGKKNTFSRRWGGTTGSVATVGGASEVWGIHAAVRLVVGWGVPSGRRLGNFQAKRRPKHLGGRGGGGSSLIPNEFRGVFLKNFFVFEGGPPRLFHRGVVSQNLWGTGGAPEKACRFFRLMFDNVQAEFLVENRLS